MVKSTVLYIPHAYTRCDCTNFVLPSVFGYPANPQSFNRYSYVNNNPINATDPTGHCGADIATNNPGVQPGQQDPYLYEECVLLRDDLQNMFSVNILGIWAFAEMQLLQNILGGFADSIGLERFNQLLRNGTEFHNPNSESYLLNIERRRGETGKPVAGWIPGTDNGTVFLNDSVFDDGFLDNNYSNRSLFGAGGASPETKRDWLFGHELGHVLLDGMRGEQYPNEDFFLEGFYPFFVPTSAQLHPGFNDTESVASELAVWAVLDIERPAVVDTFWALVMNPALAGQPVSDGRAAGR